MRVRVRVRVRVTVRVRVRVRVRVGVGVTVRVRRTWMDSDHWLMSSIETSSSMTSAVCSSSMYAWVRVRVRG